MPFSQIPREARKTGREAPSRKTHLHLRTRHHRARLAARSPSRTGSWPFYCGALSSPRWFAMCYLAATQRAAGSRMAAALSPPILTAISRSRQTTRGVSHSLISQIYSNRLPTRHDSPHRQRRVLRHPRALLLVSSSYQKPKSGEHRLVSTVPEAPAGEIKARFG